MLKALIALSLFFALTACQSPVQPPNREVSLLSSEPLMQVDIQGESISENALEDFLIQKLRQRNYEPVKRSQSQTHRTQFQKQKPKQPWY